MRRGLRRLTTVLSVLLACTVSLAAEVKQPAPQDPAVAQTGISSVTDANGHPIPLRQTAAGAANPASVRRQAQQIQRGQAWWPYASSLPPYTAVGKRAEAMDDDEIQVNGVALLSIRDPEAALELMPSDLKLAPGSQQAQKDGYYLVKIAGRTRTQEQLDALTHAGASLGEYMNVNTYFAKIPSSSLTAVKSLPFVAYVGDYHPAYKISPRIGLESIPVNEAIDATTGKARPWLFEVTLHSGAELKDALYNLAKIGIFPDRSDVVSNDALTVIYVAATPETVLNIAQLPEVKWIAEKTYASLQASASNPAAIPMVLQNNGVYTTVTANGWKLWNAGIDGSATSQIVTMEDTGLNTNMEHFAQDTVAVGTIGASHRKVIGYDVDGGDQCVLSVSGADEGHGTWTSQHAVGSISNMSTNPDTTHTPTSYFDDGIARGAKVYFRDIGIAAGTINPPADLGPSITTAIGKGSFIENNSWGTSSNTYDAEASNLDTALFNNPNFVVTVSAGNRGAAGGSTIGSPGTAKNCIAVGGNNVSSPDNLFIDCNWDGTPACATTDLGSSRGPVATSNRIKPDIMTYVYSSAAVGGEQEAIDEPAAMCQTDATKTVYWQYVNTHAFGGTSFAAPEVAGLSALVRDYFMQGFYPTGSATPANVLTPSGSLVKAVILASGEAMATTSSPSSQTIATRYSNDVGYGRANVPGVLHIGSSAPFLWVQNNASLGQSATSTTFYNINGNAIPLRVMLVWYDAAGNAIQKDANLKVTIGANVYLGNVMSGSWSVTGGVADATNTTEGVFLDAAHGLPASGQVQVDVIGFNNPGGMTYSLVVSGNVASTVVTSVSLDKGQYTCAGPINVTVNDSSASSPVSVTLTSRNSGLQVIDTKVVSCTGSSGVFSGTILAGSGLTVANGGSVTATYGAATPATASIACQAAVGNGGFAIQGGCDNAAAGTDIATGPLTSGGSNEYYNKYMDGNEYTSYKFQFVNNTGAALTDATVALSFSGAGAAFMTRFNGPVHVGGVAAGATAGGVFQLYTSASVPGLTSVNLDFDVTSPADGYSTATRITQVQLLQANDQIARQNRCTTFNTSLSPFVESVVNGHATNPWRWSGSATTPSTVGSETRTDGMCSNSTANAAAMIGNSAITNGNNFTGNADSVLLQSFQPNLRGNGPNGQPYRYNWAWHSFYHASETGGATTGVWGIFYNDQWNNATAPTGAQVAGFTNKLAYYYQTIFDYPPGNIGGTWNWDTANGGTPDNPSAATPAANQLIITFNNVTGLATNSTYFAYGQEHADLTVFNGASSATTRRDIAFDNDNLVYDEYYTVAQAGACGAGTQVGQVSFDQVSYGTCPTGPAVISVLDGNGVSGMTVTVTSPGTGDSEVVTLTGSAPYFSGTLTLSTVSGIGANNGTLFVLPSETISATYTDSSPAGSSQASATTACSGGNVVYVSNTQVSDNGDNDGIPDNNECVTMDIAIQNNLATALTNTKVRIFSNGANVDLIPDDHALYGTVAAGATATNPASDRFTFHVASTVACSDPANPPTATFTVVITADGLNGPASAQTFTVNLDRNIGGGTTSYTQSFAVNPGWAVGVTAPDNPGCAANAYANDFHWCAACGFTTGGYGAWVGNAAFGTGNQNYTAAYNSSTLYSPVFVAGGTSVTMQFREAGRFENSGTTFYDGGIVQYQLAGGTWTTLAYNTPAQAATTSTNFCSPILASTAAWTGTATGTTWTLTDAPSVATTSGQAIQFRWRLGGDISGNGATYGGFGVDDVTVTGLRAFACEPNRNGGLAPCCLAPTGLTNNTAVDPNLCAATGVQITWAQDPDNWGDGGAGTRTYTVLRNGAPISGAIAYGTTTYTDATAVPGTAYTYSVRYNNGCGSSTTTAGAARSDSGAVTCTASDQCHLAGTCNPATGVCTNPNAVDGTTCSDGNACTQTDTCQGGVCTGSNPVVCTPSDVCHVAGICNLVSGICSNPNAANGTACNDGNACTQTDTCQGGVCTGGNAVVCTASDSCHVAGTCDTGTGVCSNPTAQNGTACNDGNACTQTDTCQSGVCNGGNPVVCTASDQCHLVGTCNPANGTCSNPVAANGTACNDGNACTQVDTCQSGTCTGGSPVVCTASDQCHLAGTCNPATGACSNPNAADGTTCSDGNACTLSDSCQSGVCTGSNPVFCTALDQCHLAGTCDTATGVCSNPNATDGTACNDTNACTQTDSCQGGVCTGANPVVCTASDQCHVAGTCNPFNGVCSNPRAGNGTACNDGNACTQTDACQGGVCTGSNPVVCTASDQCHVAGTCNTANGTCSNPTATDGTSCSDGNGCTQTDTCQSGVCTGANPVVCAASDQCHLAGTCNPANGTCSNPNAGNGTACNDGNACTQTDTCQGGTCTGSNPVVCTASDQCHAAGTCNPASGTCSNPNAGNGTACNDGNACTQSDTCQSGVCTGSNPVVCTASDQCHVAGTCNPASGTCSNPNAGNGTTCNDGNACTQTDTCQSGTCTGSSPVVCTASDQCHVAGTCNPASGTCSNPNAGNGTACNDGNACTQSDTCQSGVCTGSNPVVCTASDQCHVAGTCNPASGTCSNPNAGNGTACNDGNACTQSDSCQSGVCTGSNPVVCTASDQCHVAGTCSPATGTCSNPNAGNGTACNDGNACTQTDTCQSGVCTGFNPVVCTASDQCHLVGTCNPASGFCSNQTKANGSPCNDANGCTQTDTCQGGVCTGANPVVCTASDQCHVAGTCAPATGTCSNPNAGNGTACNDGNACTQSDSCQSGTCTGVNPVVCTASDQCHAAGTCNPANGTCSNPNATDGTACSDGNACTLTDTCQSGACTGSNPVVCPASDQCHLAGTCNPANGICSNPNATDGTACSDGNGCTQTDSCQAGVCAGTNPVVCAASDQCHLAGTCNPTNGSCSNPRAGNGTACNDGNACTQVDACQTGVCTGSNPVVCAASDQCHVAGTCNPANGTCSNPAAANGTTCSDGNACTLSDTCQGGACTSGAPVVCAASDQCHVAGTCDPGSGTCSNPAAANGTTCSDGNACTLTDTCQGGACTGANPVVCAASDQCHVAGTCDTASGTCSNPTAADGTTCSDGDACTQTDSCQSGTCTGANPVICTASDQCHVAGTCDPADGTCSNPVVENGTTCNDGNACTQTDACEDGLCKGSNPVSCAASDQCHAVGTCDPASGACSNPAAPNGTACNDGNACTQTDTCQGGACSGANPVVCAPTDQCHLAGSCDSQTGSCSNPIKPNGSACNDANACTQTDTCQGGACSGANPVVCEASDQCHVAGTCNPASGACSDPNAPNGTTCNDGEPCTVGEACASGVCAGGTPITPPPETQSLRASADHATYSWSAATFATQYDVVRGRLGSFPVGPGGFDESCFDNLAGPALVDSSIPGPGNGFWYLSRGENSCGNGTFGTQSNGTPRTTATCP